MKPPAFALRAALCLFACQFTALCSPVFAQPSGVKQATYAEAPATRPPKRLPSANVKSLTLPPRGKSRSADGVESKAAKPVKLTSTLSTGLASLAVVLGLFFAAAWAVRRSLPQGPASLPNDVVEVLGRAPLAGRQFAHLVRCGNKLLLVYLAPGCAETLTEITDPAEVDRLAGLCRQAHPHSATASFRHVFQQFSREKPADAEATS